MVILAISGSLRANSTNTTLLRAVAQLAPPDVRVTLYDGLETLPHFSPDRDGNDVNPAVTDFRHQLHSADAVLISSPEYAHGVPGTLKNALDWIVSSGEFMNKPVGLINASPSATHAQASLTETLTVMMVNVIAEASPAVPVQGRKLDEASILADRELAGVLQKALAALVRVVKDRAGY